MDKGYKLPLHSDFKLFTDPEGEEYKVRPDVITLEDVYSMIPQLKGHPGIVDAVAKFLMIDRVNKVHSRWASTPGIPFSHALVEKEFKVDLRTDGEEVFNEFRERPFITVSNHAFGAMDGIILLHLVGKYREDYKLMVNMFLNNLSAMRPNFIAVDPSQSDDPLKKQATLEGIRTVIKRVKGGHPVGFFPAGAVSKINRELHIRDREWQPSVIRLIAKLGVPVIPIYFHGHNSTFFNILGLISWKIRTLRLPAEVFKKQGKTVHVSVGPVISPETIRGCADEEALSAMLREATYSLSSRPMPPKRNDK